MEDIFDLLQPWKSHVMISKPWAFPIFLFVAGIFLSVITWVRERKIKKMQMHGSSNSNTRS